MTIKNQKQFGRFIAAAFFFITLAFMWGSTALGEDVSVTLGSRFSLFSADLGMDRFIEKPAVFIQYSENGEKYERNLKVVAPSRFPSDRIVCEWSLPKVEKGAYTLWVRPMSGNGDEDPILVTDSFRVVEPVLGSIIESGFPNRIILNGRFFGARPPAVSVSHPDTFDGTQSGEETITAWCRIIRPLAYPDGEGIAGRSCMDLETGESRVEIELPQWPVKEREFMITLENRVGRDAVLFKPGERYSADLTMAVQPETAGTTDPAAGDPVPVNADLPVKISAVPVQGYHFVRWEGTENAVIPDKVTANTSINVWWDATVTAHFEKNPQEIEFDGIMSASGVQYGNPESGGTVSQVSLSWNPARDDETSPWDMRYHLYRGHTDDISDVYREQNRLTTVRAVTTVTMDLPLSGDVGYFLAVAEDGDGNRNENHRLIKVVQHQTEFKVTPKILSEIVSSQIHFDPFGTIWFQGDYSSLFGNGDVLLLDMGYWTALKQIKAVAFQEGNTYLESRNAPFDELIHSGILETETCFPWLMEPAFNHDTPEPLPADPPLCRTSPLKTGNRADGFNHREMIDENTILDYTAVFKPVIRTRAEYDSGNLKRLSMAVKGIFQLKGRLNTTFTGDYVEWNKTGIIKKLAVSKYYWGIIPMHQENELVFDAYLKIKGPQDVHMSTDVDFEKEILLTLQWDPANGWSRRDESGTMIYEMPCRPEKPGDMDMDFVIAPKFKMTWNNDSIFEYGLSPQANVWALGIDKPSGPEFQKFDLLCAARTWIKTSYGLFSRDLAGTWRDEWMNADDKRTIFSMPYLNDLDIYKMYVSDKLYIRIDWKDGINNSVLRENGADIWWNTTLDGVEYPYFTLSGLPYYDEQYKKWHQDAYFVPKRLGVYHLKLMMKGDGFLGDMGIISDTTTITVELPPLP